jgi:hypothetical protein
MALNQPGINQRDFQEGVSLANYRNTRLTLGTVHYTPYKYSDLYEPISRKIQKDLEFVREQKKLKQTSESKSSEKKRIGITEKKNLMEDILVPSNLAETPTRPPSAKPSDKKETPNTDTSDTDTSDTDKPEKTPQTGGKNHSSTKKTIRVSNVNPDKKKEALIL